MESAPSGRLCIPADDFGKLQPRSGGLPPKQLALLAVGNGNQDDDATDGREVKKLKTQLISPDARAPSQGAPGIAGYDLRASADVSIATYGRELVSTGVAALAPPGTYLRIAPRSGLALKGIDVQGGVVDPDYRGEIKVIMRNASPRTYVVEQGHRVAQLILERIVNDAEIAVVPNLPPSSRGSGGFGHAGVASLCQGSAA